MKRNSKQLILLIDLFLILLIFLFFILILCFFYKKTRKGLGKGLGKGFLGTTYEKTIYLVWRNKIENTDTDLGFGDKLRGSIFLYQYCKKHKINLKIDATHDICSDFLKNVVSPEYDISIKDEPLTMLFDFMNKQEIDKKINNGLKYKNTIHVFSNCIPTEYFENDDIEFAKFICEPKHELNIDINEKMRDLPSNFGIKHFRFDDKVFENDVDSNDNLFKKYFDILKSNYKSTDILFTNSNNFKEYAKKKLKIQTIDCNNELCKIEHIGMSTDKQAVKNSFIEFFIIAKSAYVKSFTCYVWPSNFVKWPAKMHNVPFESNFIDEKNLL